MRCDQSYAHSRTQHAGDFFLISLSGNPPPLLTVLHAAASSLSDDDDGAGAALMQAAGVGLTCEPLSLIQRAHATRQAQLCPHTSVQCVQKN